MKKSLGAKPIASPTPVWVVGTYDEAGKENFMTASWAGICCSKPPCVTVSLRKATYSYQCIVSQNAYTLSIPSVSHLKEADYFGLASGRDCNKCEVARLQAEKSSVVNSPFVSNFPLVLECSVLHIFELGLHTQFVGEIVDVKADENILDEDGRISFDTLKPFLFNPSDKSYYATGGFLGKGFSIGNEFS